VKEIEGKVFTGASDAPTMPAITCSDVKDDLLQPSSGAVSDFQPFMSLSLAIFSAGCMDRLGNRKRRALDIDQLQVKQYSCRSQRAIPHTPLHNDIVTQPLALGSLGVRNQAGLPGRCVCTLPASSVVKVVSGLYPRYIT
jgi:hypothetical protein